MEYGLIGEKLGHSFSEIIHREFGEYDYRLHEIPRGELDAFMAARDFRGINVTIPYKKDVIPCLDHTDPAAEKIGAVNTVVNRDGKLYGYNTDITGITALIKRVLGALRQDRPFGAYGAYCRDGGDLPHCGRGGARAWSCERDTDEPHRERRGDDLLPCRKAALRCGISD